MIKVLHSKNLVDGSSLSLVEYKLDQHGAQVLKRPIGSQEFVLCWKSIVGGHTTEPAASWYLDKDFFEKLYNIIKAKDEFDTINNCLHSFLTHIEKMKKKSSFNS